MDKKLQQQLSVVIKKLYGLKVEPEVSPAEAKFGDYTTNVAFGLARPLKRAPGAIAEEIAVKLANIKELSIDKAEVVGGYINLRLDQSIWIQALGEMGEGYGRSNIGGGKKIQVEFISANPTGPLTFANARGGYPGDVLARVLEYCGYAVTREFYVNDGGGQIAKLVASIKAAAGLGSDEDIQYRGEYIQALAKEIPVNELGDDEIGARAVQILLDGLKTSVKRMGISFDVWFSEKSLLTSGAVTQMVAELKAKNLLYDQDGAVWLSSSSYGDERDRVLIKSNGESVYLLNDLAYHHDIFSKRKFSKAIKIWGADHAGQVGSLVQTVNQLEPGKELDVILVQLVRLIRGGVEVKMSKRAGVYVTIEELLDEVGPDVARFFFLMRSTDSQMEFDLDLAKEQSQKNPLYYVMYSYARAHSILDKAKSRQIVPAKAMSSLHDLELEMVKQLAKFPGLVEKISIDYGVHALTFFGMETARLFHDYYESMRIIDLPEAEAAEKLFFIGRYIAFMNSYFDLLGITPTKKM